MKNTTELTYNGKLRTSAVHLRSGSELDTDAPIDNNGLGETFSPTDLVATALSACMLTVMGIAAEKRGFVLPPATSAVRKVMASNPRRISRIEVDIDVKKGDLTEGQMNMLEKVARACPVAKSLNENLVQEVNIQFT